MGVIFLLLVSFYVLGVFVTYTVDDKTENGVVPALQWPWRVVKYYAQSFKDGDLASYELQDQDFYGPTNPAPGDNVAADAKAQADAAVAAAVAAAGTSTASPEPADPAGAPSTSDKSWGV